jgi:hypothetical protein
MPHAALIAAAVSAGVGGAIAFEMAVFRPWREENWPNGVAEGLRQEWEGFAQDVKEGFREISGEFRGERQWHQHSNNEQFSGQRSSGGSSTANRYNRWDSEAEEERALRKETDEFSLHETQTSGMRARLAEEFQEEKGSARRRHLQGSSAMDAEEDRVSSKDGCSTKSLFCSLASPYNVQLIDVPQLQKHHQSLYDSNIGLTTGDITEAQSPHHNLGEASPTITNSSSFPVFEDDMQTVHQAGSDGWHSPRSNAFSDEWQMHHSADTPSATWDEEVGEGSETWTQLNDSRSQSPISPSWSTTELTRGDA